MSNDPLTDPLDLGLVDDPAPPVKTPEQIRRDDFARQIVEARTKVEVPYVPPPPTTRQLNQTEREMARGRERVEFAKEQAVRRPARPAPSATEGTVTPVFRPSDYQHETKGAVPFKG